MTNEKWEAAHKEAEELGEIAKDETSQEWFDIIYTYYVDTLVDEETAILKQMEGVFQQVVPEIVAIYNTL